MPESFLLPRLLSREAQISRLLETVMALPIDKAWRIFVEEAKKPRSDAQNAYYWGVAIKAISEHTGYEPDELHNEFCRRHFGTKVRRVPRTPHNPEGVKDVPLRTTTTDENGLRSVLTTMQFAQYLEFVIRFAAQEIGVVVPPPDPDYIANSEAA